VTHRRDIQGLRAVAVLLVALNHAGIPFLSGGYVGVDVFFVLSGFLITGILLSQAERDGRVSLAEFYVRRARRILPAAVLTLVVTSIAAHHLLNFVRARDVVGDSIWASLFAANIHFAGQGSDYFAQGQPPSPILHFWSLSVEEQFYLVWPSVLSLVLLGALFGRHLGFRRSAALLPIRRPSVSRALIVIAIAGTASLIWSIHYTRASPTAAYFSTPARAWELALGAALAVAASTAREIPAPLQVVMGWAGLAAVACAACLFSAGTAFPGYAALLPAIGAALVIGAGLRPDKSRLDVGRVLSLRPLGYVGDRSYAFYLWHWPVLIVAAQYAGHELSLGTRLLLLGGAFGLSIASYRLVEDPLRRMRWPTRIGALSWPASAAAVVAVALVIFGSIDKTARRIEAAAAAVRPLALVDTAAAANLDRVPAQPLPAVVAAVRSAEREDPIPWPLTPPVGSLRDDLYRFPDGCTPRGAETKSRICRLGDTESSKTIAVFGDSHAQMWMPTILRMALRDGWVVIPFVKVSCIPRSWIVSRRGCGAWYRWARARASALRPDVTLIIGSWAGTWSPRRAIKSVAALSSVMKKSSRSVIVMGDPPGQRREPVDCLLDSGSTMKTCSREATTTQLQTNAAIESDARKHGIGFVESKGWFCARESAPRRKQLCPLVINQTITYVDRGHVSQTYAVELAQPFRTAFRAELFR
jgi:peptidoglycan/LPS O-acetylase OafA/YrhL